MSSETWTEPAARPRRPSGGEGPAATPDTSDALQPWQLFTLAGLIGATAVVFVSRGHTPVGIVLLSLVVFAAAIVGAAAWRALGPLVTPDDPGAAQILGGRTRAALEREKTLALRSIKELEFDRAMGKVADKDFQEMSARLRLRAARLIRQLDAGTSYREAIAREIDRRVGASDKQPARHEETLQPGGPAEKSPRPAVESLSAPMPLVKCAHCGTDNDVDSRFCKHCGASLEPSE